MPETLFLTIAATGFVIAFLHAAIPTHWLPFVLTGRAQQWGRGRTLLVTAVAGAGHVIFTAVIGAGVAWGGEELTEHAEHSHEWFHAAAGAVLVLIGLFYIFRQWSGRGHAHLFGGHHHHHHGDQDHVHDHAAWTPALGPHGGQTVDTGDV